MPSALVSERDGTGRCATSPTGPDTVDDLCLGLELKFLLLGLPLDECRGNNVSLARSQSHSNTTDKFHQDQAYAAVARVLERGNGRGCTKSGLRTKPAAAAGVTVAAVSRAEVDARGLRESDYWRSHWIVKKANSVEHTADDPQPDRRRTNGVAVPVELSSPMLSWTGDGHVSRGGGLWGSRLQRQDQLHAVVARLRASLPVVANYTCDVHVHVGRQDGVAFTLPTLKMLATLCWLAEPVLRSVRDPRSPNFHNAYTWGFEQRRYSRLALALAKEKQRTTTTTWTRNTRARTASTLSTEDGVTIGEDLLRRVRELGTGGQTDNSIDDEWEDYMGSTGAEANEAVRAIWLAATPVELGQLLSGAQREHRRLGFNFSAFGLEDERARTNPRTVEFRFLEGTLAPERIVGWLRICGQLAALCTKSRRRHFRRVVRYLLAQQAVYEALRLHQDVPGGDADKATTPRQPLHPPRDALFAELMERIGLQAATYGSFQAKIRREYRCA